MYFLALLCILFFMFFVVMMIAPKTCLTKEEFQRMADEYKEKSAFVDLEGTIQTDPDMLIEMWLELNPDFTPKSEYEGVKVQRR